MQCDVRSVSIDLNMYQARAATTHFALPTVHLPDADFAIAVDFVSRGMSTLALQLRKEDFQLTTRMHYVAELYGLYA